MRILFSLSVIALALAALAGWIMNLVTVVHMFLANAPLSSLFIGRLVGVPVGIIGAILGWF